MLEDLERLTFRQRMRQMVELGQQSISDPQIAALLADLEHGNVDQRCCLLQATYGSRNPDPAFRLLDDPSQRVRRFAGSITAQFGSDEALLRALAGSPARRLPGLLRDIRRSRQAVIDQFVDHLLDDRDERAPKLIGFGSVNLVQRRLHEVEERLGEVGWKRLATFHPDQAIDAYGRLIESLVSFDETAARFAASLLPIFAESRPRRAIELAQRLLKHIPLSRLNLDRLANRLPNDVAELILEAPEPTHFSFDFDAKDLRDDLSSRLFRRHRWTRFDLEQGWPRRWTQAQRTGIYHELRPQLLDWQGHLGPSIIAGLEPADREREARRHFAARSLRVQTETRLSYLQFLPWDEAVGLATGFLHDPDAEIRAATLAALVGIVRYHRQHAGDLVKLLNEQSNEREPVRRVFLGALAELPPSVWQETDLDSLGIVFRSALDARDRSEALYGALTKLAVRLTPFHLEWSATWLREIGNRRGGLPSDWRADLFNTAQATAIEASLHPTIDRWHVEANDAAILSVAQFVGCRLRDLPTLTDMLVRVLERTRDAKMADQVLQLFEQQARHRLLALVTTLLSNDLSWIRVPVVLRTLHRHQQNVLTFFLSAPKTPGKFDAGEVRYALPLSSGFDRWTANQQLIYAAMLEEMTVNHIEFPSHALYAIPRLALLSDGPKSRLIELASIDNPEGAVREAALHALGTLDGPEGRSTLIEALADERARIAIYAIRRTIRSLPAGEALSILRLAPREQVTVAKEVIRLIGTITTDEAFQELLTWNASDLHRDVRLALLRACWDWVERDEVWPILDEAARNADTRFPRAIIHIPIDGRTQKTQSRVVHLLEAMLLHTDEHVRLRVLWRLDRQPVPDPNLHLVPALLRSLESDIEDITNDASGTLILTYGADQPDIAEETMRRLLPNRRELAAAIEHLNRQTTWQSARMLASAQAVLRVLEPDPETLTLRCTLAMMSLPVDDLVHFFDHVLAHEDFHADALRTSIEHLSGTRSMDFPASPFAGFQPYPRRWLPRGRYRKPYSNRISRFHVRSSVSTQANDRFSESDWLQLEGSWRTHSDPRLRRLGFAALIGSIRISGWTSSHIERLRLYQEDPSILVRSVALYTFPVIEEADLLGS